MIVLAIQGLPLFPPALTARPLVARAKHPLCSAEPDDPHLPLLEAVLSRLPSGAPVSHSQLRSMAGLLANDLCGCALKQLPGSFDRSVATLLGDEQPLRVPERAPGWVAPAPPPVVRSTTCIGEIAGATTWLTNDPTRVDELVAECGFASADALGFDLEWTPTMVRGQVSPTALLQLATREHCLLVRINQMARPLPPALCAVLEAETPVKVGRGVADDANRLEDEGCCDVGWVDELPGRESLKDLAARVPALPRVTRRQAGGFMTNWEARSLSADTLHYAAFDAIAAAAVYNQLGGRGVRPPDERRRVAARRKRKKAATRAAAAAAARPPAPPPQQPVAEAAARAQGGPTTSRRRRRARRGRARARQAAEDVRGGFAEGYVGEAKDLNM